MSYDSWLAQPYEHPDTSCESDPDFSKCSSCGDEEDEMPEYNGKLYCSSCSRKCPWCNDFMMTEDGDMHKACREDWERENPQIKGDAEGAADTRRDEKWADQWESAHDAG